MSNTNLAQTQKTKGYDMPAADPKQFSGEPARTEYLKAPDELLAELYVSKKAQWAFNELVNRYSCKIYKLAYKFTKDENGANDVLQEVFLALFQKLDTFRGESKFSTWVFGITRNTSLMYLKKQRKHLRDLSLTGAPDAEGDTPEFLVEDWRFIPDTLIMEEEKRYKVEEALSAIPEKYNTVLRMRDLEGRTNLEIGAILGISLSAVKSRVRRARMQLKESLVQYRVNELY